ncbi:unnamed protein product [Heterobilharzia americana]|nr:unnamed protein product [Heterobilharzia americana]CAH8618849.1 unnamed protein product [Heterobilharzia americana]
MLPNLPARIVKNLINCPALIKQSALESYEKIKSADYRPIYEVYDNLTGLDRVRSLHVGVAEAEKNFVQKQVERRACQMEVFQLEEARNRINVQLDSVKRSDDSFLKLVTELHELSRQHQRARDQLNSVELAEQVAFEQFSTILRHSQAEERIQANRMRQWTVGFSLAAGLIGFGATWIRFHQMDKQTGSIHLTAAGQVADISLQDLASALQSSDQRLRTALDDLIEVKNNLNDSMKSINEAALETSVDTRPSVKNLIGDNLGINRKSFIDYTYGAGVLLVSALVILWWNR